jgi:uncharacterized spore protein YtfJ
MTTDTTEETQDSVFDNLRETRDALTVRRVFGEAYELDGVTIIPVARVGGGAGGGGGEGADESDKQGRGFGSGFGMGANPIGVYHVRDGDIAWKPTVDVNRVIHGAQVLAGIIAVCAAIITWRRV